MEYFVIGYSREALAVTGNPDLTPEAVHDTVDDALVSALGLSQEFPRGLIHICSDENGVFRFVREVRNGDVITVNKLTPRSRGQRAFARKVARFAFALIVLGLIFLLVPGVKDQRIGYMLMPSGVIIIVPQLMTLYRTTSRPEPGGP